YETWAREVKQFEAEYGKDWDGTMIEYDSDFVNLPKYVGRAVCGGDLQTVLQWLHKGNFKERHDLMSYLLLNRADVNILDVGGSSVLTSSCIAEDNSLKAVRLLLSWGAELIDDGERATKEDKLDFRHRIVTKGHVEIANLMSLELGGRRCEIVSAPKTRDDLVGKTCVAEETPQDPGYYVESKNNRLKHRDFKSNEECRAFVASLREDVEESSEVDPDADAKAEQAAADLLAELGLEGLEGQSSSAPKKNNKSASGKKKKRGGKKKGCK
ncbi:hypothetical protein THAOC_17683, partial [Thalassiosira oceanica]